VSQIGPLNRSITVTPKRFLQNRRGRALGEVQRRRMAILMELHAGRRPKAIARRFGLDIHTVYNVRAYGLLPRSWAFWRIGGTVYCDDGSGDLVKWKTRDPRAARVGRGRLQARVARTGRSGARRIIG
jgi:hypothetical protein